MAAIRGSTAWAAITAITTATTTATVAVLATATTDAGSAATTVFQSHRRSFKTATTIKVVGRSPVSAGPSIVVATRGTETTAYAAYGDAGRLYTTAAAAMSGAASGDGRTACPIKTWSNHPSTGAAINFCLNYYFDSTNREGEVIIATLGPAIGADSVMPTCRDNTVCAIRTATKHGHAAIGGHYFAAAVAVAVTGLITNSSGAATANCPGRSTLLIFLIGKVTIIGNSKLDCNSTAVKSVSGRSGAAAPATVITRT